MKSNDIKFFLFRRSLKILFRAFSDIFLKPSNWRSLLLFRNLANFSSLKSGLLLTPFGRAELFLSRILPRLDQMPNLRRRIAHCSHSSNIYLKTKYNNSIFPNFCDTLSERAQIVESQGLFCYHSYTCACSSAG